MKTILAVGSIAIDTIQTPGGNRDNLLGGSAMYFSIAASHFAPVKLVGVVGTDYPKDGFQLFESRQIDATNIQILDGKTFRWGCSYNLDFSERKTLFTELGVFDSFTPDIRDEDYYSPLVFLGNIQPDLQLAVASGALSSEYVVSDTMNLWIDLYPERLREVVSASDIFLINHEESFQLTCEKDIPLAAMILRGLGPGVVVIKMGAKGCFLSVQNKAFYIPVFSVNKVIDPTGAGDTFAGGMMGYLAQTDKPDFIEAVLTGSAMASFCVEGFGLESLLHVTRAKLEGRIAVIRRNMGVVEGV